MENVFKGRFRVSKVGGQELDQFERSCISPCQQYKGLN